MSVGNDDLLTPKGRLFADALWPEESKAKVNARLTAYIAEAGVKVAALDAAKVDEATKHWCYYRAYDEVYQTMVAMPSSVSSDQEGSGSYLGQQIALMKELRDQALAEFAELLAQDELVVVVPANRYSRTTRASFEF